mmetsp:Transcript_14782/g.16944  ORF Transcript_14782/g.16944 Transcript_14782/m.16944 type:complete len:278 (+) Transcript_14782:117-950(+)
MMARTTAFNDNIVLDPLLEIANESSKNFDTLRTVVLKTLADPNVFCGFDEIKTALELKDEQAVGRTLDLFSYGNYLDYHNAENGRFLNLSTAQIFKLRQLTVLSLAQEACHTASPIILYSTLAKALNVTAEEGQNAVVEEILISCIYSGLISGQLCQMKQQLILDSTTTMHSRDVLFSQTTNMISRLKNFSHRLEQSLEGMIQDKSNVKSHKDATEAFWEKYEGSNTIPLVGTGNQKMGDRYADASSSNFRSRDHPPPRASNKRSRGGIGGGDLGRF